jgi:hypothetical protein
MRTTAMELVFSFFLLHFIVRPFYIKLFLDETYITKGAL